MTQDIQRHPMSWNSFVRILLTLTKSCKNGGHLCYSFNESSILRCRWYLFCKNWTSQGHLRYRSHACCTSIGIKCSMNGVFMTQPDWSLIVMWVVNYNLRIGAFLSTCNHCLIVWLVPYYRLHTIKLYVNALSSRDYSSLRHISLISITPPRCCSICCSTLKLSRN
jgi:hypothetical protein